VTDSSATTIEQDDAPQRGFCLKLQIKFRHFSLIAKIWLQGFASKPTVLQAPRLRLGCATSSSFDISF